VRLADSVKGVLRVWKAHAVPQALVAVAVEAVVEASVEAVVDLEAAVAGAARRQDGG
jgi:hypothetical protein